MRIYSMTATFGKLEHQTLTLQPGLNIIEAPNEWGKSTWCAFLVAMLYGIETRVHSTKNALADKERYAPWSGAPMSGRIDLCWNGRDITIERRTKGRAVFGDFKAYETATGVAIPQLTAANCGQQLLGVERSVFVRAGFIRQDSMRFTEDEALRRRLNALVTTGDESGAADLLERKLKELKNQCRFHKTGLLPQAQAQRQHLEQTLLRLEQSQRQLHDLTRQLEQLRQEQTALENHSTALRYAQAQQNARQLAMARDAYLGAKQQVARLQQECDTLPARQEAQNQLEQLEAAQQALTALQLESPALTAALIPPEAPTPFRGKLPEQALEQAASDYRQYKALTGKQPSGFPLWLIGLVLMLLGAGLVLYRQPIPGWCCLGAGSILTLISLILLLCKRKQRRKQADALRAAYQTTPPEHWEALARDYAQAVENYHRRNTSFAQWQVQIRAAQDKLDRLTQGRDSAQTAAALRHATIKHDALAAARQSLSRQEAAIRSLQNLPVEAPAPQSPDTLTCSPAETQSLLVENNARQHQLQQALGHCMGQMEQLGQEQQLRSQLDRLDRRIRQLEDTYAALTLAQKTLSDATLELQRRFAPQITKRSQQLFSRMTRGRYDRLTLTEDLRLRAAAVEEDTLHSAHWRSEGTADQLYLSLRLAVSEALTSDAPLVLDDALVRFDDERLAAILQILQEEAAQKQILLFTCQSREKAFLS